MSLLRRLLSRWQRVPAADDPPPAVELVNDAHHALSEGDLDRAEALCRRAIAVQPRFAPAHHLMGMLCGQTERLQEALAALDRALVLDPASVPIRIDRGHVLRLLGDMDEAAASYRAALSMDPQSRLAAVSLGDLLLARNDADGAAQAYRSALACPADGRAVKGCVTALDRLERHAEARAACEAVLAREPQHVEAHAALGYLMLKREFDAAGALRHLDRAIELAPQNPELHLNRGMALQDLARVDDAIAAYDSALAIDAKFTIARFHRAVASLFKGEYAAGWPDYELRLLSEDRPRRSFTIPRWNGEDLHGRTILVTAEQGIGDEIMFASCLPDLIEKAGHVVVECATKLEPIFRRSFLSATVHGGSQFDDLDWVGQVPAADVTCPVGSLPQYFRTTPAAFPQRPYLVADPALQEEYRQRLAGLGPQRKVGLSWRGGTPKSKRALRSVGLHQLLPVLKNSGICCVDLQYDDGTADIAQLYRDEGITVHHWRDALEDYDRTAALVAALDLVISVDTSLVHLAGALGQRVWVLAQFSPEWRYRSSGDSLLWYARARIFRQVGLGEWDAPIDAVAARLARMEQW